LPIQNRDVDPTTPSGILLYGPPGTGKSTLYGVIHRFFGCFDISLTSAEILGMGPGKSELGLINRFTLAKQKAIIPEDSGKGGLSFVFIKDIDAIAQKRSSLQGQFTSSLVSILSAELDQLTRMDTRKGKVVIFATTTRIEAIDASLRTSGRFDVEIFVGPPSSEGRMKLLRNLLSNARLAEDLDLQVLVHELPGYSGSDLRVLTATMARNAVHRQIGSFEKLLNSDINSLALKNRNEDELTREDFDEAKKLVTPSGLRDRGFEVPEVRMEDIFGLTRQKELIADNVLYYIKNRAAFRRLGIKAVKGICFWGPPGNGKTMLAKAIANEVEWNFLLVSGPELLSKYVGESEEQIRYIFHKARQYAPCIIFFDELDSIAPPRDKSQDTHVYASVVGQLLAELDGVRSLEDVIVIGASNRIDLIDPALLREGRLDFKVEIPVPTLEDRREFILRDLEYRSSARLLAPGFPIDDVVSKISVGTEGLSGAALSFVIAQAARIALKRGKYSLEVRIGPQDYYFSLEEYNIYRRTGKPPINV